MLCLWPFVYIIPMSFTVNWSSMEKPRSRGLVSNDAISAFNFRKRGIKMSLLKVENLSHSFIDKVLYENASFDLHKGEHMGIVGQNGAGKSTLMKILVGKLFLIRGALSGNLIFKSDILINTQKLMRVIPFQNI